MTALLSNREGAIFFGLIEQLIYDYVRSRYDPRLRKGEYRRANVRRPMRRATLRRDRKYPARSRIDQHREGPRCAW